MGNTSCKINLAYVNPGYPFDANLDGIGDGGTLEDFQAISAKDLTNFDCLGFLPPAFDVVDCDEINQLYGVGGANRLIFIDDYTLEANFIVMGAVP